MNSARFQNRGRAAVGTNVRRRRQLIIALTVLAIFVVPSFLTYELGHHGKPTATPLPSSGATTAQHPPATAQQRSMPPLSEAVQHGSRDPLASEAVLPTSAPSKHPNFPKGAAVPVPYRLDREKFSARQRRVVEGIRHAFVNYKKYAWGHDELAPLRKTHLDWSQGHESGIGLTAIESLDTLWLAGLYEEFGQVIGYLRSSQHTFNRHIEVGIFETTIRVLGGLLSAYELSGELILLDKAFDIGNRLFQCIEGRLIPHASVYLDTGATSNPGWLGSSQSLAEVTTIQLEFKKLSYFTGDPKYDRATTEVMRRVLAHIPQNGLYPIYISMNSGAPLSGQVTLGARGDSFYEYLAKQWALTNYTEDWLRDAYHTVSDGVINHLLVQTNADHAFIAEASEVGRVRLEFKMDHLVCFVVGMLQIGKHGATATRDDKVAGDIARTCNDMYTMNPTGLGVEIVRFRDAPDYSMYASPGAFHYIMRPEVMEAMFYMQRAHPEAYDTWGAKAWTMYEKMEEHLKIPSGWVGLADATQLGSEKRDKMESFFVAETLKYAFLCAADKDVAPTQLPLAEWVFNTEAHPLRVLNGPLKFGG